tara:strand:+ start:338 stop:604 length:267 start_codon:yes stop_codon:yes gene_type:complete
MAITVKTSSTPSITVRVGQASAHKIVSSSSFKAGNLASINDVDVTNRSATNTLVMYNATTQKYEHVSPYHLVDMSDGTQDNAMDAGLF